MRLIDADELNERFESSCTTECACCPYSGNNCGLVHEADTVNAIVIPEGATNGDIIKAMFPYIKVEDKCSMYYSVNIENLSADKGLNTVGFRKDWWNAPYKSESEEKE